MTINLSELSDPFNARYKGTCNLETCERRQRIDQGDVVQYIEGVIYHMVCARRIMREQVAPLCKDCWNYHNGECA